MSHEGCEEGTLKICDNVLFIVKLLHLNFPFYPIKKNFCTVKTEFN